MGGTKKENKETEKKRKEMERNRINERRNKEITTERNIRRKQY